MAPAALRRKVDRPQPRSQRFSITAPLRYVVSGVEGEGCTLNASSSGLLIQVPQKLPAGRRIRLFIQWPARLDGRIPLLLFVNGTIVRSTGTTTAVAITNYEFRLSAAPLAVAIGAA